MCQKATNLSIRSLLFLVSQPFTNVSTASPLLPLVRWQIVNYSNPTYKDICRGDTRIMLKLFVSCLSAKNWNPSWSTVLGFHKMINLKQNDETPPPKKKKKKKKKKKQKHNHVCPQKLVVSNGANLAHLLLSA